MKAINAKLLTKVVKRGRFLRVIAFKNVYVQAIETKIKMLLNLILLVPNTNVISTRTKNLIILGTQQLHIGVHITE